MTEAMGHGVNQRKAIQMTPEEVEAFLAERRAMTMCSIVPRRLHPRRGHVVRLPRRLRHRRDQGQVAEGAEPAPRPPADAALRGRRLLRGAPGRGAGGRAEIVDDPDKLWTLGVSVFERYNGPYSDELKPFLETMLHKRVAVKLHVERTVSWDHRKLGLPSTRPDVA